MTHEGRGQESGPAQAGGKAPLGVVRTANCGQPGLFRASPEGSTAWTPQAQASPTLAACPGRSAPPPPPGWLPSRPLTVSGKEGRAGAGGARPAPRGAAQAGGTPGLSPDPGGAAGAPSGSWQSAARPLPLSPARGGPGGQTHKTKCYSGARALLIPTRPQQCERSCTHSQNCPSARRLILWATLPTLANPAKGKPHGRHRRCRPGARAGLPAAAFRVWGARKSTRGVRGKNEWSMRTCLKTRPYGSRRQWP